MSRVKLGKLVDNIKVTGCYEPLVVRLCPKRPGCYQIINGHHRCQALRQLGRKTADTIVWDVDDAQTDILLTTLNRLHGRDSLDKKLAVLRRLDRRVGLDKMADLLPQTRGQIERLTQARRLSQARRGKAPAFAIPVVFFVSEAQQSAVEEALAAVTAASTASTKAAKRAAALTQIARQYLDRASSNVKREMEDAAL